MLKTIYILAEMLKFSKSGGGYRVAQHNCKELLSELKKAPIGANRGDVIVRSVYLN